MKDVELRSMLESLDVKDRESVEQFEGRKSDHMRVAMDPAVQSDGAGFDQYSFVHEALPDLDFDDVSIASEIFSGTRFAVKLRSPFFVSSMTAGHGESVSVNERLAKCAEHNGWAMGVGSQRRELFDRAASTEWKHIRAICPSVRLFGNIGLSQLIHTDVEIVRALAETLQATAMIVHLNPLQEALQPEGTPRFRGGLHALEKLVRELDLPVIVKETGCGISAATAKRLIEVGVHAIDVAGRGGTHWGRIEGIRAQKNSADGRSQMLATVAATLADWGLSTCESLRQAVNVKDSMNASTEVWASGGVRSGLDGAKAIALGASAVGVAQPMMAAALGNEATLDKLMARFDYELKTILFCQGVSTIDELKNRGQLMHSEKVV